MTTFSVFKIRDKRDGLFSEGGQGNRARNRKVAQSSTKKQKAGELWSGAGWNKTGKTWSSSGHIRNHLAQLISKKDDWIELEQKLIHMEVVVVTVALDGDKATSTAEVYAAADFQAKRGMKK
jgi:hypothetical protein